MGTENYTLIAADVRDTEDLTKKLEHIDKNLPTLVLTECLLVYMKS
jgi:O-methyltransferase involved in polyketide biosynthesis